MTFSRRPAIILLAAALAMTACGDERAVAPPAGPQQVELDPALEREIVEWRERRAASLTRDTGWLTLTGLFWLAEGENSVGSGEGNRVRLPEKAPERVGTLTLREGTVTLSAPAEAGLRVGGEPVGSIEMAPDVSGSPTIAEIGAVQFLVIERGGKIGVRVRDREHPARTSFAGLDYFPIDPKWRVEARLEPYDPPKQIPILNIIGIVEPAPSPGALVFTVDGREHRLDPIAEEGSDELFVIFADRTSGRETYPAGRYLYAERPGPDGTTILDFNRSYSPPCAFTEFATCPLPPRQNRLAVRVEAGEKNFEGAH
ncbi:MAG TPA: DUF1684 domain-containing protein [Thermoanaerobaculia bacterium]|nr:DUF1684 domain-containing protein [Thermoanaerobaculia bacterium]